MLPFFWLVILIYFMASKIPFSRPLSGWSWSDHPRKKWIVFKSSPWHLGQFHMTWNQVPCNFRVVDSKSLQDRDYRSIERDFNDWWLFTNYFLSNSTTHTEGFWGKGGKKPTKKTPKTQQPQTCWPFRWFLGQEKIASLKLTSSSYLQASATWEMPVQHIVLEHPCVHASHFVEDTFPHKRRHLPGRSVSSEPQREHAILGVDLNKVELEQWFGSTSAWRNPVHPL